MKRLLLGVGTIGLLLAAVALSGSQPTTKTASAPARELSVQVNSRNPWTHLRLNNDPSDFRFAIVSDRTGGHRAKVFARAVEQLNLLQPEFVVSVGDLIEGYKEDPVKVSAEWREFQAFVYKLQMPFFYVPGNHDIANPYLKKQWDEKFGRAYYHFLYRDVLFLCLNANDPTGKVDHISPEQAAWAKKVLDDNCCARWTIVLLHKPLWANPEVEKTGWMEVEKALGDRQYTVFAGHVHIYKKYVRNGHNFYQLATTGGGSKMRGVRYGEFDHIAWITMKKEGPVIANVLLDGVFPEDMRLPPSEEQGYEIAGKKSTVPVKGKVFYDGCPIPDARVTFYEISPISPKLNTKRADALVEVDGSFELSTYTANDGVPQGEYIVTVTTSGPSKVPAQFTKTDTSPLRAKVKLTDNDFTFELKQ